MNNRKYPTVGWLAATGLVAVLSYWAATVIERGHAVYRVNFNGGDRAFWRLPGAVDFRGRPEEWPEFLDRLIVERAISDIILFGDCRP